MKNKLQITHKDHHLRHRSPPQTTTPRTHLHNQACAACRYQRRKCTPDCILAPYFPHDRQRQFQNAHKLFGVSNITKILKNLNRFQRDEAMRTVIYESDARAYDPVGGCFRIVKDLYRQIEMARLELEFVLQQLAFCRTGGVQNSNGQNNQFRDGNGNGNGNHEIGFDEIDYDIQDEYKDQDEFVWEDKNMVEPEPEPEPEPEAEPIQSWPAVRDSQPLLMLHSSVCDDLKSLLIDENEPREENLFDEGNEKGLIKVENVCFSEEDYETKNASFGIMTADHKAIQVVGK